MSAWLFPDSELFPLRMILLEVPAPPLVELIVSPATFPESLLTTLGSELSSISFASSSVMAYPIDFFSLAIPKAVMTTSSISTLFSFSVAMVLFPVISTESS